MEIKVTTQINYEISGQRVGRAQIKKALDSVGNGSATVYESNGSLFASIVFAGNIPAYARNPRRLLVDNLLLIVAEDAAAINEELNTIGGAP
jgi:hypothetical protein